MTFFGLFAAAHEFHQFGLCLDPILVRTVVGSVARLIDLISAGPYLVFREGTRGIILGRYWLFGRIRFLANLDFGFRHFNSWDFTTKRGKLQNG